MPFNPMFVNGGKSGGDDLARVSPAHSSRSHFSSPEMKRPNIPKEDTAEKKKLSKCQFYATFTFTIVVLSSFSALLFLVPFVVDPALATLTSDFAGKSVDCRVIQSKYILGASYCGWSSCREGCTRDIYECHQILVEYSLLQEDISTVTLQKNNNGDNSNPSKLIAALFVNVKGCGYPPTVQCASWIGQYGVNESIIPCYYSRTNTSMATTHIDTKSDWRDLMLALFVPLISCLVSATALCILHTDCCNCCTSRTTDNDGSDDSPVQDLVWKKPDILAPNSPLDLRRKSLRQRSAKSASKKPKLIKTLSFKKCSVSVKRKADLFEVPTFSKKLKTEDWQLASSTENLIPLSWRRSSVKSSPTM